MKLRIAPILVPALFLVALWPAIARAQAEPATDPSAPVRLLVGLNAPLPASQALSAAATGAEPLAVLDACSDVAAAASEPVIQVWQAPPGDADALTAWLRQQPEVLFVEPEAPVYAAQDVPPVEPTPTEAGPVAAAQAAVEPPYVINDPLYATDQWAPQRINLPRAWQAIANANFSLGVIRVAVIDSGVDFTHPDLAGRLLPGKNYLYHPILNPNPNPVDDNGHGTHVSGIIAAITNNGQGVAGTALSVMIDPRKVLNSAGGGGLADLATALCEAARDGARVINMSVQIPPSFMPVGSQNYATLKKAVDYATSKGSLLVAAGGNTTNNSLPHIVYYPALFDNVVAVAASTVDNVRPSYGPIGAEIDIMAPGGDRSNPVLSTWPSLSTVRSRCLTAGLPLIENKGGWYCGEAGTSMASPYVAGAAALVMSVRPSLSAPDTRALLQQTARNIGLPATEQGAGLLDAEAAVRQLVTSTLTVTPTIVGRSVAPGSSPFTLTVTVSNPSAEDLRVTSVLSSSWFTVTNPAAPLTATVNLSQPLLLSIVVSPTNLATGTYTGTIELTGTRPNGTTARTTVTVFVAVGNTAARQYLPKIMLKSSLQPSPASTPFTWETPVSPTVYAFTGTTSVTVDLPFEFPLSGPVKLAQYAYDRAEVYGDGFLVLTSSVAPPVSNPGANRCLDSADAPGQAVFGWWADLDPGDPSAEIAGFQPAANRFVIQYRNVPSAVGITPAYRVSFQVVLYANGNIGLNYLEVPGLAQPGSAFVPVVTAGVQARGGLFSNQLFCTTGPSSYGSLPAPEQSVLIRSEDIY